MSFYYLQPEDTAYNNYYSAVCPMFWYYSYFQNTLEILTTNDTSSGVTGDVSNGTSSDVSGDTATNTALSDDVAKIKAINFLLKDLIVSSCQYVSPLLQELNGSVLDSYKNIIFIAIIE